MNPTTQFIVKNILPIEIFGADLSITNSSLSMIIATSVIIALSLIFTSNLNMIPCKLQSIAEIFVTFIQNMLEQYAGKQALSYLPLVVTIFLIILFGNLLGIIPGLYTFTSQIIITFTLALITFLSVILIGLKEQGLRFFKIFAHGNMPLPITLFIIPIEIVSFFARPVSLCLRLCINMIAGHMMLKIFANFATMLPITSVAIFPLLIILTVFEILVACLQAYIFTMLTCIYLKDAVNVH